ncbi:MAG: hypothetical protein WBA57_26300 [Elainellaceae cyanobacterium]
MENRRAIAKPSRLPLKIKARGALSLIDKLYFWSGFQILWNYSAIA